MKIRWEQLLRWGHAAHPAIRRSPLPVGEGLGVRPRHASQSYAPAALSEKLNAREWSAASLVFFNLVVGRVRIADAGELWRQAVLLDVQLIHRLTHLAEAYAVAPGQRFQPLHTPLDRRL